MLPCHMITLITNLMLVWMEQSGELLISCSNVLQHPNIIFDISVHLKVSFYLRTGIFWDVQEAIKCIVSRFWIKAIK